MLLIEASGVGKTYGLERGQPQAVALHPTTLAIGRGEFVAIVGPSGSGKSTLMNLLGLLDRPSCGQLLLDGTDCSAAGEDHLARLRNAKIGFVFQSYHLLARHDALANVELPLLYGRVHARERRERAEAALGAVGLLAKKTRFPAELSGGEQQRVAIARAMVAEPALILADEPTGALDTVSGRVIMDLLKTVHRAGRTVVMVTHDQGIAAEAERRLTMRDGRLISDTGPILPLGSKVLECGGAG